MQGFTRCFFIIFTKSLAACRQKVFYQGTHETNGHTRMTCLTTAQHGTQHPFFAKNDLKVLSLREFAVFLHSKDTIFLLKTI